MAPDGIKVTEQGRELAWTTEVVYRDFSVHVAHPGHKWGRSEVMILGQPRRGRKKHCLEVTRADARKLAESILALLGD